ncbi:MAG: DUF4192 family protein, partial [Actinobacteria bacterium]
MGSSSSLPAATGTCLLRLDPAVASSVRMDLPGRALVSRNHSPRGISRAGRPQTAGGHWSTGVRARFSGDMSLRIDSPDAAVAATPFLIGFPPEDSVVLLLLDEHDSLQVSMRVDLPVGGDLAWLQSILRGIPEPVPWSVLILAYADAADPEFAQAAGMWVMHALLPVMEIVDLVMVAHGQYSSMSRGDAEVGEERRLEDLADHP